MTHTAKRRITLALIAVISVIAALLVGGVSASAAITDAYTFDSDTGTLTFTRDSTVDAWDGTAVPASDIKMIIFSPDVSTIPGGKFHNLPALEQVDFQGNVTVGASFCNCPALREVNAFGTLTITGGAFSGSNNIEELDFRRAVTFRDGGQFASLQKLTSVTFPAGSNTVGGIFGASAALEEIIFLGDVEIVAGAFGNIASLKKLNFEGKVNIQSGAFPGTNKISEINFGDAATIEGGIFSSLPVTSLRFPAGSSLSGGCLFSLSSLEELYFEGDIDISLGGTLSSLPALKTVYFGGTSKIAQGALSGATNLESVTFIGATNLNGGTLAGLKKLKSLAIPAGSVLGSGVLYDCSALEEITFLGDCVIAESAGTLYSLASLKTVTFMGAVDCQYDKAFTAEKIQLDENYNFEYPTNPNLTVIFKADTPNVNSGFLTYLDPAARIIVDCDNLDAYKAHFEADTGKNATRANDVTAIHSTGATGDLAATCTSAAYCSACSSFYGDPNPTAHAWNQGSITTPANCSAVGTKTFVCEHNAEHTRTEDTPIEPDTHEWDSGVLIEDPTCTSEGTLLFTCIHNSEHTRTGPYSIDPDAHSWDDGTITTPATCSAVGTKTYTCIHNSEHTRTEDVAIASDAHSWDDGTITTPATCSAVGTKTFVCSHNSEHTRTEDVAIVSDAHSWDDGTVTTTATCSAVGTKTFVCEHNAEHTRTEDVAIVSDAHSFGAWKNEVAATTDATGTIAHKTCSICSKNFAEDGTELTSLVIPKLDAPADGADDGDPTPDPDGADDDDQDSLSGGAIAGIAIGSTVVGGTGGFSLFWFVIKKKKWSDLVRVFKKK